MTEQEVECIVTYLEVLRARPPGYTRDLGSINLPGRPWESNAWDTLNRHPDYIMGSWEKIYPVLVATESLMGVATEGLSVLDYADNQEFSEQFYALYESMLIELLRSHGVVYGPET